MNRIMLGIACILLSGYANAAVVVSFTESGGNVEAELSGNLNLGAVLGGILGTAEAYNGYQASIGGFASTGTVEYYTSSAAWTPFGTGGYGSWDSSSGDAFALFTNPMVAVPVGYVSEDPLSATATKNGATFASLGFVRGVYVTTLTNGKVTDTVTVFVADDPFTPSVSNETPPSEKESSPAYSADGAFDVSITDGTSCTGTYDIAATPVVGSSPLGNTPPPTIPTQIFNATAADGLNLFVAGAGSYDITVTEIGRCVLFKNPEVITATVPGHIAITNQTGIQVEGSYIKLETLEGQPPPDEHCANNTHDGRMVVDSVNDLLYICTQSGWIAK